MFCVFFYEVSNLRNRTLTNQKQELVVKNYQWNCMTDRTQPVFACSKSAIKAQEQMKTQFFKVNNEVTGTMSLAFCENELFSLKNSRRRFGVFIATFKQVSYMNK